MTQNRFPARRIARSLLVAGLIAAGLSASFARAQVTLNFVNADIDQVAKAIGVATDKTIIVDPRVKGQLNLVSEQPVPEDQALKTLQSALRMQGFALVQDHGVLKVVPEADAKLQGVPTYVGNTTPARGDQVVTQIIKGIDTSAGSQVQVVPLKNASAVDVAQQLGKLLDPGAIGGTDATLRVSASADPRTNSVLLRAASPSRLAAAKSLISTLDAPTTQPGNIHVVPLRNADAVRMAKTLRGMFGQGSRAASSSESQASGGKFDSFGGGMGGSTGIAGLPPLPSGSSSARSSNPLSSGGGIAGSFGSGQSKDPGFSDKGGSDDDNAQGGIVQADAATNSLIIIAPEPLYRNVRNVIDQLDQRRAQVYIEAVIVDMNATTGANLGIQWQGALLSSNSNNVLYGASNLNGDGSQGIVGLTATGALVAQDPAAAINQPGSPGPYGLLNNGLNLGLLHRFGKVFGLGGLLQALATNKDTNILSTPNLITLDNEEARIVVGENVPVMTGSYATSTSNASVTPFNTFDRQDVGTTLHIKPQISEGDVLKLQIYQENSAVQQGSKDNPGGVSIVKRSIQSTVLADDGEIIVLGGLIQDNYANGNTKVPLLGDIPVIGSLFRSESKTRTKSNLMVFLRPVIVRDQKTSTQLALDRYEYLRAEQASYRSDNRIIKDREVPRLPPAQPGPSEGGGPAVSNVFDLRSTYGRGGPYHGNGAGALSNGGAVAPAPASDPALDAGHAAPSSTDPAPDVGHAASDSTVLAPASQADSAAAPEQRP
ncbi:hypothetical protein DFQ30_011335 [Apophysomyces sp. BC1015]|nr:hypothetical protein DFQ30_011335 [Apophysomyces sp. BC1015]